jgi:hypothetical protein
MDTTTSNRPADLSPRGATPGSVVPPDQEAGCTPLTGLRRIARTVAQVLLEHVENSADRAAQGIASGR